MLIKHISLGINFFIMAIPSRQIGWGTEENLLWEISKQLESLTGVAYNVGTISGTSGTSGLTGLSGTSGTSGVIGTSGTSGDSALWNFLGPYQVQIHNIGDVVTFDGETWYCIQYAPSGYGPFGGFIDTYWTLIAAAGTSGISGTAGTAGTSGVSGGYLGSFYDTTNQTGLAGTVLTMGLNNSDSWNNGVSIVSGNRITIANPGVYNLSFSTQLVKTAGNTATHAHIWLSQNGTNVPNSASQIGFPLALYNAGYIIAAWNFFFKTSVANEYVQLKWEIDSDVNNAITITSAAATGNIPAIPGLIVTVNQVG